jgi:ferrochelatase
MSESAVLVMAYGTPAGPQDIEAYYTHIRHGRPPTAELLADLRRRYDAIGQSPLLAITNAQVAALQAALERRGHRVPVALGMKHASPFIEDAVADLARAGAHEITGVVLAPHYSRMSVGEYTTRATASAERAPGSPSVTVVRSWHLAPGYLHFLASALQDALSQISAGAREGAHVLFTAHSLPERILGEGDPYPAQLLETATALAERLGLERWSVAWQSAGRTADPWIGPDVLEVMGDLAGRGTPAVVVCSAGFVADHLEVLYDLDIEARDRARELGIEFARTASPNDDRGVMDALAQIVLEQAHAGAPA